MVYVKYGYKTEYRYVKQLYPSYARVTNKSMIIRCPYNFGAINDIFGALSGFFLDFIDGICFLGLSDDVGSLELLSARLCLGSAPVLVGFTLPLGRLQLLLGEHLHDNVITGQLLRHRVPHDMYRSQIHRPAPTRAGPHGHTDTDTG